MMRTARLVCAGAVAASLCAAGAFAQPPQAPAEGRGPRAAEVTRLFDAYALLQAQEMLGLSEDQYARFVPRFTALQDVRRRSETARLQQLLELMRATAEEDAADEAAITSRLKALSDLERQASDEIRQAVAGVDEVLTVRQQARFRVFENQLERRKLELMMRARQATPRPGERRQVPRQR